MNATAAGPPSPRTSPRYSRRKRRASVFRLVRETTPRSSRRPLARITVALSCASYSMRVAISMRFLLIPREVGNRLVKLGLERGSGLSRAGLQVIAVGGGEMVERAELALPVAGQRLLVGLGVAQAFQDALAQGAELAQGFPAQALLELVWGRQGLAGQKHGSSLHRWEKADPSPPSRGAGWVRDDRRIPISAGGGRNWVRDDELQDCPHGLGMPRAIAEGRLLVATKRDAGKVISCGIFHGYSSGSNCGMVSSAIICSMCSGNVRGWPSVIATSRFSYQWAKSMRMAVRSVCGTSSGSSTPAE